MTRVPRFGHGSGKTLPGGLSKPEPAHAGCKRGLDRGDTDGARDYQHLNSSGSRCVANWGMETEKKGGAGIPAPPMDSVLPPVSQAEPSDSAQAMTASPTSRPSCSPASVALR